jgi:hypothetical protein
MGGEVFIQASWGKTADEAFKGAVEQAEYNHGHCGYTGTIAEKTSFVMITLPKHKDPLDLANELIEKDDERIHDKWGPAGCIKIPEDLQKSVAKKCYTTGTPLKVGEKLFLFFGWASS